MNRSPKNQSRMNRSQMSQSPSRTIAYPYQTAVEVEVEAAAMVEEAPAAWAVYLASFLNLVRPGLKSHSRLPA
jgi:hypothetical protein